MSSNRQAIKPPAGVPSVMRIYARSWVVERRREFVQIGMPEEGRGVSYEVGTTLDYVDCWGARIKEFRAPGAAPVEFMQVPYSAPSLVRAPSAS